MLPVGDTRPVLFPLSEIEKEKGRSPPCIAAANFLLVRDAPPRIATGSLTVANGKECTALRRMLRKLHVRCKGEARASAHSKEPLASYCDRVAGGVRAGNGCPEEIPERPAVTEEMS